MNQKGNKSFIVSKSFPTRYKEAKAKLNEMGSALRKLYNVNTELIYEGVSLGLWYRQKKTPGEERGEWIKHHEIDPTTKDGEREKPRSIGGKSLFLNFKEAAESPQILESSIMALLEDYSGKATYKAITASQLGIFFHDVNETKTAETTLRNELKDDAKIIRF